MAEQLVKSCPECRKEFADLSRVRGGHPRTYCADDCRKAAERSRRRAAAAERLRQWVSELPAGQRALYELAEAGTRALEGVATPMEEVTKGLASVDDLNAEIETWQNKTTDPSG